MGMLKRKEINVREVLNGDRIEYVPLDEAIAYLQSVRDQTNETATLEFDIHNSYGDYYVKVELSWTRPETDAEYEKRCNEHRKEKDAAARRKERQEADERALLAKLKAKYES